MVAKDIDQVIEEAQHKRIATLLIAGGTRTGIAKELGCTKYHVDKVMRSEEFKLYLKELSDECVNTALNTWKSSMSDLIPEALSVLKHHLKEKNLEGVKLVMKAIGAEKQEQAVQSSAITVVLPNLEEPKPVDIEVT